VNEFAKFLREKVAIALRAKSIWGRAEVKQLLDQCITEAALSSAGNPREVTVISNTLNLPTFTDARGIGQNGYTVGVVTGTCPRCGDTSNAKGLCCGR
jgi:hypothetical protein